MIKVEAIVREDKFEDVKAALNDIQVNGMTVFQVMGDGVQNRDSEVVRGQRVDFILNPKVKFEIVVSSEEWEQKTIKAIQAAAYTGNPGDGKIFSYDLKFVMRIRTQETGYDAIN
jgi:nitrogen regulatory protein P-II 1